MVPVELIDSTGGLPARLRRLVAHLLDVGIGHDAGSFGSTYSMTLSTTAHISWVVSWTVAALISIRPEPTAMTAAQDPSPSLFVTTAAGRPPGLVVSVRFPRGLRTMSLSPCAGRTVIPNVTPPVPFVTGFVHSQSLVPAPPSSPLSVCVPAPGATCRASSSVRRVQALSPTRPFVDPDDGDELALDPAVWPLVGDAWPVCVLVQAAAASAAAAMTVVRAAVRTHILRVGSVTSASAQ